MAEEPKPKSWWQTLPGVLTATTGVITALTGLLVALHEAGVFAVKNEPSNSVALPQPSPTAAPGATVPAQVSTADGDQATRVTTAPAAQPSQSLRINLLAPDNGGHLVVGSGDHWKVTIDGNDDGRFINGGDSIVGEEAVYAFQEKRLATFDTFAILIPGTGENIKKFELLISNDAPTGQFRSLGEFQTQNLRSFENPFQEFRFAPVTARYLKFRLLSSYSQGYTWLSEFRLLGQLEEK